MPYNEMHQAELKSARALPIIRRAVGYAFERLALGVTPSQKDCESMDALAAELASTCPASIIAREVTFTLTHDEGLPLIKFYLGRYCLADCWIEFSHSPMAFFYWES